MEKEKILELISDITNDIIKLKSQCIEIVNDYSDTMLFLQDAASKSVNDIVESLIFLQDAVADNGIVETYDFEEAKEKARQGHKLKCECWDEWYNGHGLTKHCWLVYDKTDNKFYIKSDKKYSVNREWLTTDEKNGRWYIV